MSELFSEDATQARGKNYGKELLSAYKETSNINTLFHHQATKAHNRKEFLLDMIKEVTDKINNGNFSLIRSEEIPERSTLLPGVGQMKRKGDIKTLQIKKNKAKLNVHVSRMKKVINYKKVY